MYWRTKHEQVTIPWNSHYIHTSTQIHKNVHKFVMQHTSMVWRCNRVYQKILKFDGKPPFCCNHLIKVCAGYQSPYQNLHNYKIWTKLFCVITIEMFLIIALACMFVSWLYSVQLILNLWIHNGRGGVNPKISDIWVAGHIWVEATKLPWKFCKVVPKKIALNSWTFFFHICVLHDKLKDFDIQFMRRLQVHTICTYQNDNPYNVIIYS